MLERIEHANGIVTYQSPLLRQTGVIHGFSTRRGGVSEGPYHALNLGPLAKGDGSRHNTAVAENFRRLRAALQCDRLPRIEVRQVHGCDVWCPPARPIRPADAPQADAIISDQTQAMLTIRIADCVPLLLANRAGTVVAAVHAGWRGMVAGVIGRTVAAIRQQYGQPADQLVAAVGPCISLAHFEVGDEVAQAFEQANLAAAIDRTGCAPHIDLPEAARLTLIAAGLPGSQIDTTDRCTYRDEADFFSHRRDQGVTGRMAAVIVPKQP